jgi:hypothetical protein
MVLTSVSWSEDNGDGYHPTLPDPSGESLAQSRTFDYIDPEHYLG